MVSLIFLLIAAQAASPVSPLALDSFPPAARQAIADAHAAAAQRPSDAGAAGRLARTLHAWEQWGAAHDAYARAIALAPEAYEWRYLDAVVLQRLARHADAAARLREVLARAPGYLPARLKLAEALLESGQLDESRQRFRALVDEPAAAPAALVGLGRIAAAGQEHAVAIDHLRRAVSLFPELGAAHYTLARSYRALGRLEEAQAALSLHERFGARWPALPDPVLTTVTALREDGAAILQRAVKLADAGDLDAAIAAHEAALARDPGLAQAHANLIALYGRARNWAKAEQHYHAFVQSGGGLADAHYDYGVLLGMQEKWDQAADAYRQAIAINPLHAQARNNLGQVLERQRRLSEAADAYRQALASQPGLRVARFNLARMLIALNQPEEAAAELERIVEPRDEETPRYLFALSVAMLRLGRKDAAMRWAMDAKQLALQHGQADLAAAIDRELALLK